MCWLDSMSFSCSSLYLLIAIWTGAVKEKSGLIIGYIVLMVIIIIMQFSFGVAAGAVASGSAPQISGPFIGVLNENYRYFDWQMLSSFWQPACYYASANFTMYDYFALNAVNVSFHFPACDFYGKCAIPTDSFKTLSPQELSCCNTKTKTCATSNSNCASGNDCVLSFLGNIAAP
jgi:hypothetical protein